MMIEISMTGGFHGLPSAGKTRVAELNNLPETVSTALCEAFNPNSLASLSSAKPFPGRADTITYEIIVTDTKGPHRFKLDETQIPPETLDLIDEFLTQ